MIGTDGQPQRSLVSIFILIPANVAVVGSILHLHDLDALGPFHPVHFLAILQTRFLVNGFILFPTQSRQLSLTVDRGPEGHRMHVNVQVKIPKCLGKGSLVLLAELLEPFRTDDLCAMSLDRKLWAYSNRLVDSKRHEIRWEMNVGLAPEILIFLVRTLHGLDVYEHLKSKELLQNLKVDLNEPRLIKYSWNGLRTLSSFAKCPPGR
jgi:hypothetical protein